MNDYKQLQLHETILISIFIAHDMPIIGYKFPSILYAILVIVIFFLLFTKIGLCGIKKIIPLFLIPILNFIIQTLTRADWFLMLQGLSGLFQLFTYTMVGYTIYKTNDLKSAKILLLLYTLLNTITCFTTGYGCSIYPGAARHLAIGDESVISEYGLYKMANIDGFSFVYTMVLTFPIIIYWYRNISFKKNTNRIIPIILFALYAFLIIKTEYTIALLLSIFLCLLFVIQQKNINIPKYILISIVCFFTFELFAPFVSEGLQYIAQNTDSRDMSERLNDLSYKIIGKETETVGGDLDARSENYMTSFKTFLSNPLGIWVDEGNLGGHSYILDNIAKYGLIGIFLIWIMIKTLYVRYVAIYKGKTIFNYALFILLGFIILIFFNTGAFYTPLTFTLPLFILLTENKYKIWK